MFTLRLRSKPRVNRAQRLPPALKKDLLLPPALKKDLLLLALTIRADSLSVTVTVMIHTTILDSVTPILPTGLRTCMDESATHKYPVCPCLGIEDTGAPPVYTMYLQSRTVVFRQDYVVDIIVYERLLAHGEK